MIEGSVNADGAQSYRLGCSFTCTRRDALSVGQQRVLLSMKSLDG